MNQDLTVGGSLGIMLEVKEELSETTNKLDISLREDRVIPAIMNVRSKLIH